jgi:hypothetical protein
MARIASLFPFVLETSHAPRFNLSKGCSSFSEQEEKGQDVGKLSPNGLGLRNARHG